MNEIPKKNTPIPRRAERIRDVIRYIRRFKNATVVIYIDDALLASPLFTSHIRDICLIHEAGLQVLIVPGARNRIDQVLNEAKIEWTIKDGCRIADEDAMPLIKMAAFDVSNRIMTALAGENGSHRKLGSRSRQGRFERSRLCNFWRNRQVARRRNSNSARQRIYSDFSLHWLESNRKAVQHFVVKSCRANREPLESRQTLFHDARH